MLGILMRSPSATKAPRPPEDVRSTLRILALIRGQDALHLSELLIRVGHEPSGDLDGLRHRRLVLELVDCRPAHRALHRDRLADRRYEDHVAGQELAVRAGVAVQQQVVQIERGDQPAGALERDPSERPDLLHATAHEQRVRHGGQTAHRIRPRLLRLAEHEHADGPQLAHRDADAGAHELLADALLDFRARVFEGHAADVDGAELGEIDAAVALRR